MRAQRRNLTILATLAAFFIAAAAADAAAGIRVKAKIRTPDIRVRIGDNTPDGLVIHHRKGFAARRHTGRIARRDIRIAKRIAWYTGVPVKRLARMRRRGFNWFEIGRSLRVPRPVVRAAMSQKGWPTRLPSG